MKNFVKQAITSTPTATQKLTLHNTKKKCYGQAVFSVVINTLGTLTDDAIRNATGHIKWDAKELYLSLNVQHAVQS